MPDHSSRGPLTHIILAQTGEDVRNCINCELCDQSFRGIEFAFNDLMQAASRDDLSILAESALWDCDSLLESDLMCLGGIDIPKVVQALRHEAQIRGFKPHDKSGKEL